MAQTIDNQVMSLKAQKYLTASQEQAATSRERLGSGLRVNSAQDDAAGLAISERLYSELQAMNQSIRNANDGLSMTQIADGGLSQISDKLQRMRELAVQSSNGTNSAADRENLNAEFTALNDEISRIASATNANGVQVLASEGRSVDILAGSGTDEADFMTMDLVGVESLSTRIDTYEASMASIDEIDSMMAVVANSRAGFGAMQSRFESTITNLQVGVENQSAARARIVDADYALETAMLTRAQILEQGSTAMTAQANAIPTSVMQLLE